MTFLLLLVGLSIPFWVLGAIDVQLAPRLPLSALMAFCPMTAALILVHREGRAAATALLWRAVDCRRIRPKTWYAPILLLMPAAAFLSYLAMRLVGAPLPSVHIPILAAPAMLLLFHVSAVGEELGWSGYLIDRLPDRWNALQPGIVVGLVWAAWHFVPLVQADRSLGWIAWWSFATISARVLLVWLYYSAGRSVFAVSLCHATQNVSWQLFPNRGSHYDPRFSAMILGLLAAIVVTGWRPRRLGR